jgi:hypothetical protein
MTYIDSALLDFVERLCHRFQILTGRTNLWLAFQLTNLSIVVYFVWTGVYLWNSHGLRRAALLLFCIGLLYLLAVTVFKVPVETQESGAYRRVSKGFRNPRRLRDAPLRIAFLTLSVVLFFPMVFTYANLQRFSAFMPAWVAMSAFLSYSLILLTAIVLYLLACDPLPPCAGRVTEWIRALFASRVPASAPERQGRIIGAGGRSGIRRHRTARTGSVAAAVRLRHADGAAEPRADVAVNSPAS